MQDTFMIIYTNIMITDSQVSSRASRNASTKDGLSMDAGSLEDAPGPRRRCISCLGVGLRLMARIWSDGEVRDVFETTP